MFLAMILYDSATSAERRVLILVLVMWPSCGQITGNATFARNDPSFLNVSNLMEFTTATC